METVCDHRHIRLPSNREKVQILVHGVQNSPEGCQVSALGYVCKQLVGLQF